MPKHLSSKEDMQLPSLGSLLQIHKYSRSLECYISQCTLSPPILDTFQQNLFHVLNSKKNKKTKKNIVFKE